MVKGLPEPVGEREGGLSIQASELFLVMWLVGVSKTTFTLNDLLKELTSLKKSFFTHGCGLLNMLERYRLKSAKARGTQGKVQETVGKSLPRYFLTVSCARVCIILPATMCDNTRAVLSTRQAHADLGVWGFYWVSVTEHLQDWL
jgi:hypothetical protein